MAHNHHHHAHLEGVGHKKAFIIGITLNLAFVVIEIFYGILANSSALLADAGHNASDVLSLVFAWAAAWMASMKPFGKYTYGLRRTTILVSILNALLLFGAVVFIGIDAYHKIINPESVAGLTVTWVAAVGIVINTVTALLFMRGQKEDLNIKGAFLHMAADAGVSLGVVIAGLLIAWTGILWIDPVISFAIIIVIVVGTWRLFTDSIDLALDAVPKDVDYDEVKNYLNAIEGVEEVHDLHIWAMSTTQKALTAHLVVPEGCNDQFLFDVRNQLLNNFGIDHTTIQIEKTFADEPYRERCG